MNSSARSSRSRSNSYPWGGGQAMRHIRFTRKAATIIALAAFAAGCATQQGGSAPAADTLSGDCNPLVAGGIGAAIGALAGGSKNRGTGAAAEIGRAHAGTPVTSG